MLFPLLWEYVEGCNLLSLTPLNRHPRLDETFQLKNGLYTQCSYLIRNPTICPYVKYVHSCVHSKHNSRSGTL